MRRLNRTEYNNTMRDLLGTAQRPADEFPPDEFANGFDNNGDVLTLSPVHLEVYQRAAEALVNEALQPGGSRAQTLRAAPADFGFTPGAALRDGVVVITASGEASVSLPMSAVGTYTITISAYRVDAAPVDGTPPVGFDAPSQLALNVGGFRLKTFPVSGTADTPAVFTATVDLAKGLSRFSATLLNGYVDNQGYERRLVVTGLTVEGPAGVVPESPQRKPLLACAEPDDRDRCAAEILGRFARRAFRRGLFSGELGRLMAPAHAAWDEGLPFDDGIRLGLQAILLSPHFLFRPEIDQDPRSLSPRHLSGFEVASRLSYFLWSSTPDDELLDAAERGDLLTEDGLRAQVERLLTSPKAVALIDDFASEWLQLRDLANRAPDPATFPAWTPALRASAIDETRRFFSAFLQKDAPPASELLTADYSYPDARLASFYRVEPPRESGARASLRGSGRQGLLGQASLLTVTSHPTRTSPVRRGKWVLEQLLCSPPPAPPAVVPSIDDTMITGTTRQRFEAHRNNPACAACHKLMDPIGFGLENFDAIGAFRMFDEGLTIDASGTMPDGASFKGPQELAMLLAQDPRLSSCLTEKLFVYALGRGVKDGDASRLATLSGHFRQSGQRLRDLITQIILSDAFRARRGEPEDDAASAMAAANGGTL